MANKKDQTGNQLFKVTFTASLIIFLIIIGFYYSQTLWPSTQHLPENPTFNVPDWMKFISVDTDKVLTINFNKIYQKTGNSSFFTSTDILTIYGIGTKITTLNIEFLSSILYPNPKPESDEFTLNIIKPEINIYTILKTEVEEKNIIKYNYKNNTIYQVLRITSSEPSFSTGFISFNDNYILYSEHVDGLEIIKKTYNNLNENNEFTQKPDIKASFYLLLTGKNDELGYSYSKLPYSVNTTTSVSTSVRYENNYVFTRQIFQFNDTTVSSQNLNKVKQANLNAYEITVIDNYIVTNTKYDKTLLLFELRTI